MRIDMRPWAAMASIFVPGTLKQHSSHCSCSNCYFARMPWKDRCPPCPYCGGDMRRCDCSYHLNATDN